MGSRTLSTITTALQLDNRSFKKGLKTSKKDVDKFSGGMKKLGGAIGGAFALRSVANFTMEVSKLAGVAEGVATAFNRIKPNIGYLEQLKTATAGTVSEMDLMRRAVMASNFKIPLGELSSLLKFATKRAQETGESVNYLVNSIVIGIGRKSPLILDNLGISAVELRKKLEGVGHSGATVGDVAAAVGAIASEELGNMGDLTDTVAVKQERLTAEVTNMKVEFGKAANVLMAELIPAANRAIQTLSLLAKVFKNGIRATAEDTTQASFEKNLPGAIAGEKKQTELDAYMRSYHTGLSHEDALLKVVNESLIHYSKLLGQAYSPRNKQRFEEYIKAFELWRNELTGASGAVENNGRTVGYLQEQLKGLIEMQKNTPKGAYLDELTKQIKDLRIEIDLMLGKYEKLTFKTSSMGLDDPSGMGGFFDPATQTPGQKIIADREASARSWRELQSAVAALNETTDKYGDIIEEIFEDPETQAAMDTQTQWAKDTVAAMDTAGESTKALGELVGVMMVNSFDDLGEAITKSLRGAADALNELGEAVLANLGNILIMVGLQSKQPWMVAAGAALQLGSGLIRGLGKKAPDTVAEVPGYGHNVQFKISGNDLIGVIDGTNSRNNYVG